MSTTIKHVPFSDEESNLHTEPSSSEDSDSGEDNCKENSKPSRRKSNTFYKCKNPTSHLKEAKVSVSQKKSEK